METILTIIGTRPEIIRLSEIIRKLDILLGKKHKFVYLNQNYDKNLKDVFFECLNLRWPDVQYQPLGSDAYSYMSITELAINEHKPDKVLVLGDTNSTFCSTYIARRNRIPVYHMEAGNRCWDEKVPEEINRKAIDHMASFNLCYTNRSADNLYREGLHPSKVYVTGNPIAEVLMTQARKIQDSDILDKLKLQPMSYVLCTFHREENVDNEKRLAAIYESLLEIAKVHGKIMIISTHPRTKKRLEEHGYGLKKYDNLRFYDPFNFIDFCYLMHRAAALITDSGTAQEEGNIMGVPTLVLRDSTERIETTETGSSIVSGVTKSQIIDCFKFLKEKRTEWKAPPEYTVDNVSEVVTSIVLGNILK